MEIKELYIKNFGKLSDRRFLIQDGIHIFYGENEYGKSTIYAFIKAMFFGLERGRGRAALNDEFSRYEPWENPNYYAGVLRFSSGGKCFRLERSFDRYTKSTALICEDDGEELSVEDGDLDMLLGGISRETFESTVAIGQLAAKPGNDLAEELKNFAANYYETGCSTVDLAGALETLRARRKAVDQECKILLEKLEIKKESIRQECQYVSNDAEKLRKELEDNQEKIKSLQHRQNNADIEQERPKEYSNLEKNRQEEAPDSSFTVQWKSYITMGIFGVLAGTLGKVWGLFASSQSLLSRSGVISVVSWLVLGIGILLLCLGGINYIKDKKAKKITKGAKETEPITLPTEAEDGNRQRLEWENQRIKAEWKEKQVRFQNLQEQLAELEIPDDKMKSLKITKQALALAENKMLEASKSMAQGFGNILNRKASEILGEITNGRYDKLMVDDQLNITLLENGRRIPVGRVSAGTIEQVYFALRMAASDILYEEPLPVIFDEAFAFYDEKRLKSTLKWLSEQQRQVIIFTCQKREQEIVLHS